MADVIKTTLRSKALIENPLLNKGAAFTQKERDQLHLHGLVPEQVSTIDEQIKRRYARFSQLSTPLEKALFLSELQNTDEILYYKLVTQHIKQMLPLVYTPTVGDLCLQFSELHTRYRGLYLSIDLQDKLDDIFAHLTQEDVRVVVVTDGERILGLGDLGVGGIAIPIGKLALYTLFGGIHPSHTLPIVLDVGTNNPELKNNPYYLGRKQDRIRGERYDKFIEAFIRALKKRYPKVLLQWEDFAKNNAARLLKTYQDQILSFNDDIQGTAAVALSALMSAAKIQKIPMKEQKIVILGAGSAGLGIAEKIVYALRQEGLAELEAYERVYLIDREGLLLKGAKLPEEHKMFAKTPFGQKHDLEEVVAHIKPTALIGVSGQGGAFKRSVIETMASYTQHPAIFPLSNPNKCAEATPQDLLSWTKGQAIIATGSPFGLCEYQGQTMSISQCNNVYIFPGIGLGATSFNLPVLTDKMFLEASKVLSLQAPVIQGKGHDLFPPFEELKETSLKIALKVVQVAIDEGYLKPLLEQDIKKALLKAMWTPDYPTIVPA